MERRSSMIAERAALLAIALAVAALALPACTSNHDPGKRNVSLNNLKFLALAMQAYVMDYGGTLPGWVRNPDGRYAHNVWDEQINPNLKAFTPVYGDTDTRNVGIRSYADRQKQRVLTYGLNGMLIAPNHDFDGHAPIETISARRPPAPMRLEDVTDPARTILLAEMATEQPMTGRYGRPPDPLPRVWLPDPMPWPLPPGAKAPAEKPEPVTPSRVWLAAHDGWIDISPREFVETTGAGSYNRNTWDPTRGVARALHAHDGGGFYAFVDGHVQFMRLADTVGLGRTVTPSKGAPYTVAPGESAWRADNPHNMWNPKRAKPGTYPGD